MTVEFSPCYVCGRVDPSGVNVVFDDSTTMTLCHHCAVEGIKSIDEKGEIDIFPSEYAIWNAIDSLESCEMKDLFEMFDNKWGKVPIMCAVSEGIVRGFLSPVNDSLTITPKGEKFIARYNRNHKRWRE